MKRKADLPSVRTVCAEAVSIAGLPPARAFLFDMDGTIVNNCAWHVLAWQAFSEAYGNRLSERQILDWMGATNLEYQRRILGREVGPEESVRLENEKEAVYRKLYAPHMKLAEGLRPFLDEAHRRAIACAIVSGAPRQNIDFICSGLNLFDDFPCIVDASQYARSKPEPDCYLTAAERLGVSPADCIVFEDAVGGIVSGRRAGMYTVALTGTNPRATLAQAEPDLIIDSFLELSPAA